MTCQQAFLTQLRERGFRLTPQREMVLQVMHQIGGPATAEEILARVQAISSCVDISTVYRTVDLLQEFHLVACIDPGDGQHHRYTLLGADKLHLHLVCRSCGKVIGITSQEAQPFLQYLDDVYAFQVDLAQASIPGLCRACRHLE